MSMNFEDDLANIQANFDNGNYDYIEKFTNIDSKILVNTIDRKFKHCYETYHSKLTRILLRSTCILKKKCYNKLLEYVNDPKIFMMFALHNIFYGIPEELDNIIDTYKQSSNKQQKLEDKIKKMLIIILYAYVLRHGVSKMQDLEDKINVVTKHYCLQNLEFEHMELVVASVDKIIIDDMKMGYIDLKKVVDKIKRCTEGKVSSFLNMRMTPILKLDSKETKLVNELFEKHNLCYYNTSNCLCIIS